MHEDLERFPERAEHFGIATLEAMAFGCVPIVIRAGGQSEIVEDGRSGFLCSDTDELKKITGHVVKMFGNQPSHAYLSLSSNACVRASRFSKARTQQEFLEVLSGRVDEEGLPTARGGLAVG
jgi:glycosyltransferase involved in cell wall biosynthesis